MLTHQRKLTTLLLAAAALLSLAKGFSVEDQVLSLPPEAVDDLSTISESSDTQARQLSFLRPTPHVGRIGEPVELVVPPYENYQLGTSAGGSGENEVSYVFDHKRFIDSAPTRCMSSTAMEDPYAYEPSMVLITPTSETRLNATAPANLIVQAGFDNRKKTTIVVHGFGQSYPSTVWLRRTRALFETNLVLGKQNLFIMDYGKASNLSYAQVAALASGMGAFLSNFVMKLYQLGQQPMDLHLIGHSLGSHVVGFAGKRLRPKVGRITGLDPAGPCFGKVMGNGDNDRLGPNDAYMVDVFHYDDDFLGLPGQVGQYDVYVNGGRNQPGCDNNVEAVFQALLTLALKRNRVLSESHTRSTEVGTARLTSLNCHMVAYECPSYESFLQGECGRCDDANNQCHLMQFDHQEADSTPMPLKTTKLPKKFYISTSAADPFCLQHYQILVKFQPSPELALQAKRNKWRIQMEAFDSSGVLLSEFTITNQMSPSVFSYLYLLNSQPIRIKSARVKVLQFDGKPVNMCQSSSLGEHKPTSGAFQLPFQLINVEVNFMSHDNPKARQSLSSRLCPVGFSTVSPNSIDMSGWLNLEECQIR